MDYSQIPLVSGAAQITSGMRKAANANSCFGIVLRVLARRLLTADFDGAGNHVSPGSSGLVLIYSAS